MTTRAVTVRLASTMSTIFLIRENTSERFATWSINHQLTERESSPVLSTCAASSSIGTRWSYSISAAHMESTRYCSITISNCGTYMAVTARRSSTRCRLMN